MILKSTRAFVYVVVRSFTLLVNIMSICVVSVSRRGEKMEDEQLLEDFKSLDIDEKLSVKDSIKEAVRRYNNDEIDFLPLSIRLVVAKSYGVKDFEVTKDGYMKMSFSDEVNKKYLYDLGMGELKFN